MAGESGKLQVFWDPHSQPSRAVAILCRWVKRTHLAYHIAKKTRLSWNPILWGKVEDGFDVKKKLNSKWSYYACCVLLHDCRMNKIECEEVHISLHTKAHKTPEYLSKWSWWWMNLLIDSEAYFCNRLGDRLWVMSSCLYRGLTLKVFINIFSENSAKIM